MNKAQVVWNARYEKLLKSGLVYPGDPWLKNWLNLVPQAEPPRALDVGCGPGYNTKYLIELGYDVRAIDFSEHALELCRRGAPKAKVEWADFRKEFPFVNDHFELIVADLSLHYFPWGITERIVSDIASRLVPGGIFAGRFNATGDTNYGSGSGEQIPGESNLLLVGGIEKRFFTRACFDKLFKPPWTKVSMVEKTTKRFGPRKVLWEVVTQNHPSSNISVLGEMA